MVKQFGGISGAIKRGILTGSLTGRVTAMKVRELLPVEKKTAPDKVIYKSLNYLTDKGVLRKAVDGFYPAMLEESTQTQLKNEVMVVGKLLGTTVTNGKIVANVEVTSLDYK